MSGGGDLGARMAFAVATAEAGGAFALSRFRDIDGLTIESKGHQDLVSDADRQTEELVRRAIAERFPDDGIVGEEYPPVVGRSGYDWVIDPIDGTANFVRGIPHWCCVIACTHRGLPVAGAICDPSTGETFRAGKGLGAFVNGRPLRASGARSPWAPRAGRTASNRRRWCARCCCRAGCSSAAPRAR